MIIKSSYVKQLLLGVLVFATSDISLAYNPLSLFNKDHVEYQDLPHQKVTLTSYSSASNLQNTSYVNLPIEYNAIVQAAELMAPDAAKRVLTQARVMSLEEQRIISGGCWDYLNEVFSLAGAGRETIFKGSYNDGPYATSEDLRAGDWLYFINHGYHDIEHSGLFIGWVNPSMREALVLSYAGENRQEPARYKVYDVSHVYQIIRPTRQV